MQLCPRNGQQLIFAIISFDMSPSTQIIAKNTARRHIETVPLKGLPTTDHLPNFNPTLPSYTTMQLCPHNGQQSPIAAVSFDMSPSTQIITKKKARRPIEIVPLEGLPITAHLPNCNPNSPSYTTNVDSYWFLR